MEVNDSFEEAKALESAPETPAEEPQKPVIHWLRVIYSLEFLFALLTVLTLWSEVGGQSHLDMMPWYLKLICIVGAAWCTVRFTAAIVESPKVWNRRSIIWFLGILLVAVTMGAITFYYHLREEVDQDESDEANTAASVILPGAPRLTI